MPPKAHGLLRYLVALAPAWIVWLLPFLGARSAASLGASSTGVAVASGTVGLSYLGWSAALLWSGLVLAEPIARSALGDGDRRRLYGAALIVVTPMLPPTAITVEAVFQARHASPHVVAVVAMIKLVGWIGAWSGCALPIAWRQVPGRVWLAAVIVALVLPWGIGFSPAWTGTILAVAGTWWWVSRRHPDLLASPTVP